MSVNSYKGRVNVDILYITDYFSIYLGGTRILFHIIKNLHKQYRIGIVTRYSDVDTLKELSKLENVFIFTYNKKIWKSVKHDLNDLIRFIIFSIKTVFYINPKVLHLQVHIPNLLAYLFPKKSIVTIWHIDTFEGMETKHRMFGKLVQLLEILAPASVVHVIDKHIKNIVQKFRKNNVILLPVIIDLHILDRKT